MPLEHVSDCIIVRSTRCFPSRLRYAASAVCETLFVIAGIAFAPHIGWASPQGAAPFRVLAEAACMHGSPLWLSFTIFLSPLPFRFAPILLAGRGHALRRAAACLGRQHSCRVAGLPCCCGKGQRYFKGMAFLQPFALAGVDELGAKGQTTVHPCAHTAPMLDSCRLLYPVLACQSGLLMLCAPRMCRSAGLQQGCAAMVGLARKALQRLWPPLTTGAAGRAAAGGSTGAHQLCAAACQPSAVILGGLLVGYLAYSSELGQRRCFVLRRHGGGQQRLLRGPSGLPVRPLDFWLSFGLPLACTLAWLHLSVPHLR